MEQLNSELQA
jgi:hypothetical protein